jgi:hypothetical protein
VTSSSHHPPRFLVDKQQPCSASWLLIGEISQRLVSLSSSSSSRPPPPSQYTVHSTQYTVHSTQYTVHSTQYTVHSTQYTAQYSTSPSTQCTQYTTWKHTLHYATLHYTTPHYTILHLILLSPPSPPSPPLPPSPFSSLSPLFFSSFLFCLFHSHVSLSLAHLLIHTHKHTHTLSLSPSLPAGLNTMKFEQLLHAEMDLKWHGTVWWTSTGTGDRAHVETKAVVRAHSNASKDQESLAHQG